MKWVVMFQPWRQLNVGMSFLKGGVVFVGATLLVRRKSSHMGC